jgi:hypothetical protein
MTRSTQKTSARPALVVALLCLCAPAFAADPRLEIPEFGHLKRKAVDTTDITLGTPLLRFAAALAKADPEDHDAQTLQLLRDVKSVRVRNYEFDEDGAYSKADIDSVRRQLAGPGWNALVQAHKRAKNENVDVYLCTEGDRVLGLAVIASNPRSFTIVNIVGDFDIDKLARLEGQFHIPRTTGQ